MIKVAGKCVYNSADIEEALPEFRERGYSRKSIKDFTISHGPTYGFN
jgi:hypothetical protein